MHINIETGAMRVLINTLLSCRCPVPEKVESEIISIYKEQKGRDSLYIDYGKVLEAADKSCGETPFHRLKEFIIYNINELGQELFITRDDVLRHFATMYHWRVVENSLLDSYKKIIHIPSWFVAHMLLPVILKKEEGEFMAEYTYGEKIINLKNIFVPKDMEIELNTPYCMHLSSIISPLDRFTYRMISRHLKEIPLFVTFREDQDTIDFSNFQRYGDYRKICEDRYNKYFA